MWQFEVPNAPCGVERKHGTDLKTVAHMFLMHRVELKVIVDFDDEVLRELVPNAPCGVESL